MAGITGLKLYDPENNTQRLTNVDYFSRKSVGQWIIYRFLDDNTLSCDTMGEKWSTMIGYLPYSEVRFVVCNFNYKSPIDKVERVKRVFLMWAPDAAKVRDKLKITMYSKDAQKILGMGSAFHVTMQANEIDDAEEENVIDKIKQNSTVF